MGLNSFAEHVIKGNFPKLKNWAQVKVKLNPVIQFIEFRRYQ